MSRKTNRRAKQRHSTEAEATDPLRAFDELRARVAEIDALASAANGVLDAVPWVADRVRRRRLDHLAEFVVATAKAARVARDESRQIAAALRTNAR